MKTIDFLQAITILANIAVIIGIVVLIVEVDQNSASQAFQARALLLTARVDGQSVIVQNAGGIVDLLEKVRTGQEGNVRQYAGSAGVFRVESDG